MVQIGEKLIDYNGNFRLFIATRNPSPEIPPDARSIISEINFTTTNAGLTSQVSQFISAMSESIQCLPSLNDLIGILIFSHLSTHRATQSRQLDQKEKSLKKS